MNWRYTAKWTGIASGLRGWLGVGCLESGKNCTFLFKVFGSGSLSPILISSTTQKYVNIPSEKYFYVHIYVCICVYTYLCKMDERRSYAGLS